MKNLSIDTLILIGFFGSLIIIFVSMLNWRRSVYAALVVALFEGAIRKWLLPQASELVYFLKDIILLGAYVKFYLAPDIDVRRWRLGVPIGLILAICFMVVITGAFNTNIGSPILAAYGVKIYLWYLPLALMMPYLFRSDKEMTDVLFNYALISIPICLLGAAQFFAGPESWINVYAPTKLAEMHHVATFGAGSEKARISGTFSYITGHSIFVLFFFLISLGLLSGLKDKRRWIILMIIMPLLVANGLMSGSRGTVYSILIMAAFFSAISMVHKIGSGKNIIPYLVLAGGAVILGITLFFGSAMQEFQNRRKYADDSTAGRMMYPVNSVVLAAKEVGMSGYGIGMSHPATEAMRITLKIPPPKLRCPVYDAETGQVLAELGFPGFLMWYFLRVMMFFDCWNAFRKAPPSLFQSMALVFFCFHAINLTGSMVLNHTANLFVCASWGFCLIPKLKPLFARRARLPSPQVSPQEAKIGVAVSSRGRQDATAGLFPMQRR